MTNRDGLMVTPENTLALLWERVRERGDLPGFSKVVSVIVAAMHGDNDREFSMTRTVLSDPTLTQRVLRLANSAMYSAFGQGINTVSKAVIVLGTETIGHLALGLKLIDGLSAASENSANTRNEMEKAVLAGQIARQVASSSPRRDTEEVVVCSMLHSLGRLMISFYLSEQWEQIQQRCDEEGISEDEAAVAVLGLGLDEIGRSIGKRWGFPAPLIESLKHMPPQLAEDADEPLDHLEWLAAISTMSTSCADLLCAADGGVVDEDIGLALTKIAGDYADMLGLDAATVLSAVELARQLAKEDLPQSEQKTEVVPEAVSETIGKPADAASILSRGVVDVRNQGGSVSTGRLMTMALETVYQGLGLSRAIIFLRNHDEGKYTARMCFGERTEELLPQLVFADAYQPDVFHAALANDKMIFVEDAQTPDFVNKLPRWWRNALPTTRSFVVLPLMLNFHPVGFMYGDWDATRSSRIMQDEAALLDELRALVVGAIEYRTRLAPNWARTMG